MLFLSFFAQKFNGNIFMKLMLSSLPSRYIELSSYASPVTPLEVYCLLRSRRETETVQMLQGFTFIFVVTKGKSVYVTDNLNYRTNMLHHSSQQKSNLSPLTEYFVVRNPRTLIIICVMSPVGYGLCVCGATWCYLVVCSPDEDLMVETCWLFFQLLPF